MFFIHGKKDGYIKPEQALRIYGQAGEPKFIWIVPKARHNRSVDVSPALYNQRTVAFFKHYLLQGNAAAEGEGFAKMAELKPIGVV